MPKISLFDNIGSIHNPKTLELDLLLEYTRDGEWEDLVTECRLIKDKEERNAFKRKMPTATFSGVFEERRDSDIISHSGYLGIDLDEVENLNILKGKLKKDKYVYSVFLSASGTGLRVIFMIEIDKHREAFYGISEYLRDNYNVPVDPNGVNISKPYVVSFDPDLFIAFDKVATFKKYVKETPIKDIRDFVHTTKDFKYVLGQITGRSINICDSYHDWLKVGFSFAHHFGEEGREFFHDVSRQSVKYKQRLTNKQYDYCLKGSQSGKKAVISTFYYLAKINNVNIFSEQTKTIIRTTKNGKRSGLTKPQIIENLKKNAGIEGAEEIIDKLFESNDTYEDIEEESILPLLEMFISSNYNLKMNEVTGFLEQNDVFLAPSDLNSIFVSAKKIIPKLDYHLMIRLLKSDFVETYNPFYKYFGSDGIAIELPAIPIKDDRDWNTPLITKLAESIENEHPAFTFFFLRKWLVSVISSMHKVHSPLMLALLGGQNTGKTEWFRRLLPKAFKPYYAESKLDKGKDDELVMCENILVMDDELSGKSKQDNLKINNITSTQWYSIRRPYGDHNEKILRLAVLCGTSNYLGILNDPTGNRRLIPIEVTNINKDLYNSINKDELWKEIYELYKAGFDWRITHFDIPYLNSNREKYEVIVPERELICKYFEPTDDVRLYSTEIKVEIEYYTHQKLNMVVIGRELERLGFAKKSTRDQFGNSPKKWCVKRINRAKENTQQEELPPF